MTAQAETMGNSSNLYKSKVTTGQISKIYFRTICCRIICNTSYSFFGYVISISNVFSSRSRTNGKPQRLCQYLRGLINDCTPIALTSLLMKSFEKIVLKYMLPQVGHLLDPLQFAYISKCSVEAATLSPLTVILEHLGSYARILFVDFSS